MLEDRVSRVLEVRERYTDMPVPHPSPDHDSVFLFDGDRSQISIKIVEDSLVRRDGYTVNDFAVGSGHGPASL